MIRSAVHDDAEHRLGERSGGSRRLRTSATRPVTWIHATPNIGHPTGHGDPDHSEHRPRDRSGGSGPLRTSATRPITWIHATPNIGHPTGRWIQTTPHIGHPTGHVDPRDSEHRPPDRSPGCRPPETSAPRPVTWIHATPNIGHPTGHVGHPTGRWIQATPNIAHAAEPTCHSISNTDRVTATADQHTPNAGREMLLVITIGEVVRPAVVRHGALLRPVEETHVDRLAEHVTLHRLHDGGPRFERGVDRRRR